MAKLEGQRVSIDEALEETKFGRFNYCLIIISGFVMINVVLECLGISFVLPVMDCDMNLTYQEKGFLGAAGFLGIISSSHLWGFLADTTGRRNVMRITLVAEYIVSAISSCSPNLLTLAVLRYVNGFLLSGASATIYAYLGEFHCNRLRNRALMSAAFISAITAIFHPIVAWVVINQSWYFHIPLVNIIYKPWRLYILVIGLLGFICGIALFYFPESPKFLLSIGREEDAIKALQTIYSRNTGNSADSYEVKSLIPDREEVQRLNLKNDEKKQSFRALMRSMWNQTAPLFGREHFRKTVLACIIQFWIFFTAHGLYMWYPFLLNKVMQLTGENPTVRLELCEILYLVEADASPLTNSTTNTGSKCVEHLELSTIEHTLSLEFIYVGLFLGVGYFTEKLGRVPTFFLILLICGVCGILSALITIPIVAVYMLVVLLVCGLATTVLNVITVDLFPTHLRAMAVCISLMMGRIGSMSGTSVFAGLLENHCKAALLTASMSLILSGLLGFLLPKGIQSNILEKSKNQA